MLKRGDGPIWQVLAKRLKSERERCGYTIAFVADSLPAKADEIRAAENGQRVPRMALVIRLASLYGASLDYLFGAINDPDVSYRHTSERLATTWVMAHWKEQQEAQNAAIRDTAAKMDAFLACASVMTDGIDDMARAVDEFQTLNPEFEDMRGGAKVMSRLLFLKNYAIQARARVKSVAKQCDTSQQELPL